MLTALHLKSFLKHSGEKNIQSNQSILNDIPPVTVIWYTVSNLTADLKAVQHKQIKHYNRGLLLFKENHNKSNGNFHHF